MLLVDELDVARHCGIRQLRLLPGADRRRQFLRCRRIERGGLKAVEGTASGHGIELAGGLCSGLEPFEAGRRRGTLEIAAEHRRRLESTEVVVAVDEHEMRIGALVGAIMVRLGHPVLVDLASHLCNASRLVAATGDCMQPMQDREMGQRVGLPSGAQQLLDHHRTHVHILGRQLGELAQRLERFTVLAKLFQRFGD